jgi:NADH:ubiquinone oxidoreductase subunit 2 (subunit N)
MVIVGGLWGAFQRSLGRLIGFAVMSEIGLSLLVIGADVNQNVAIPLLGIFFAMLVPWGLSLGLWALAVATILRAKPHLTDQKYKLVFQDIKGLGWELPFATGGVVVAIFSLAGLPLLAGFPPRLALWNGLGDEYLLSSIGILLGSVGLMVGGVRTLIALVKAPEENGIEPDDEIRRFAETRGEVILLVLGIVAVILLGLFPQWLTSLLSQMADVYLHLGL